MNNGFRDWGVFALVQVVVCFAVYGSALWGTRFLAPLDIAPAIFPAYKFVDPTSNGIPDNHYIIDQLTYDLPLQTIIYDAYSRGEIPWWDPYTYGGRPLLADAHINGTDPIRIICYLTLPFHLAYNWNLILHSLVAAAGMFAILRFWRFGLFTCTTLAVTWQCSGAFVMHFGHPWIAGTFVWFPFIWICWERALTPGASMLRNTAFAALLSAASFYSGNLQSHLYLPVFAMVFLIGHWSTNWRATARTAAILGASGVLGAALAAPVLANQIEFFLLSTREVSASLRWWEHPVRVLLSLGSMFPWATGTFRTLDIGKVVKSSGAAWLLFCGSATFALFVVGLFGRRSVSDFQRPLWKMSVGLVTVYFLIIATPLAQVFYLRIAPLAVLGMVPLAAIGLAWLTSAAWTVRAKVALATAIGALVMATAVNTGAFIVYPAVKNQITEMVLAADSANKSFPAGAPALRKHQVDNFPSEVSFLNPETILSSFAMMLFSASLGATSASNRRNLAYFSVITSLVPLISFASRFVPDHPTEVLERVRAGGTAQRQAIELVQDNNGRLLDRDMQVFPYAIGALYRAHTVHGYSALQPAGIFRRPEGTVLPAEYGADFAVSLTKDGELFVEPVSLSPPKGRLVAIDGSPLNVRRETLNSLVLHSPSGPLKSFHRTDTPYPGWKTLPTASIDVSEYGVASLIQPREGSEAAEINLLYSPTHLASTSIVATSALAMVVVCVVMPFFRSGTASGATTPFSTIHQRHEAATPYGTSRLHVFRRKAS